MAGIGLDEGLEFGGSSPSPKRGFAFTLFYGLKFIIGLLLLPLAYGFTLGFSHQLNKQSAEVVSSFVLGIVVYMLLYVFVYKPRRLHDVAQAISTRLFGFFSPLRIFLTWCLPFYSLLFFGTYFLLRIWVPTEAILGYFIFLLSFGAMLHFVFASEDLKEEDSGSALKGNYLFSIVLIYIFGIILVFGMLKIMVWNFNYFDAVKEGFGVFVSIHKAVFTQLFVIKGTIPK